MIVEIVGCGKDKVRGDEHSTSDALLPSFAVKECECTNGAVQQLLLIINADFKQLLIKDNLFFLVLIVVPHQSIYIIIN
jgi:hypothetical protein